MRLAPLGMAVLAALVAGCSARNDLARDGQRHLAPRAAVSTSLPPEPPAALGRRDPAVYFSSNAPEPNYVYRGGRDPRSDRAVAIDCEDVLRTGGERALATFRTAGACGGVQAGAFLTTEAGATARRYR